MFNISTVATLYVSQKYGNDKNSGFFSENMSDGTGPFKSIEKALETVKKMRLFGAMQPVTIRVTDEEYFVEKPIVINNEISGVTIEPYKKTKIIGAKKLSGFKKDKLNGAECISADVSELIDKGLWFTDFYVNDGRASLTRYPEEGFLYPEEVENNNTALFSSSKWFIAKKEDLQVISKFKNFGDCLISYNHFWIDEHTPIESYDIETGKIVFSYASRFAIEPTHPAAHLEYIIENVREGFKNPGEWYLDREDKKIYYIPTGEEDNEVNIKAYLPITSKLFVVEGEENNKVEGIRIRGFELCYTRGEYKSIYKSLGDNVYVIDEDGNGYASDIQSVCWAHGSIEFKFAHGCFLEKCVLKCMGVHAVVMYEGCDNINILSNKIINCGGGGISISGGEYGSEKSLHTYNNTMKNNFISTCGRRYFSACGILIRHAYENVVSHNTITDLYYTGISVGWVWGYKESICRDNIIEYNHVYDIGKNVLSDMGGIYLLGKQKGTVVNNNLVHKVYGRHYGGWGIYTDEGSSYITVENNICYDFSQNAYHQHFGNLNVARNNIFAFAREEAIRVSRHDINTGMIFDTNIIVTHGDVPAYSLSCEDNCAWMTNAAAANNVVYNADGKETYIVETGDGKLNMERVRERYGFEENSIVTDPCFKNIKEFDFTLLPGAPALEKGFKNIDMSNVGADIEF